MSRSTANTSRRLRSSSRKDGLSFDGQAAPLEPVELQTMFETAQRNGMSLLERIRKEQGKIHHWLKGLAPSDALRKWYHSNGNWIVFKKRYFKELSTPRASGELELLYKLIGEHSKVTLVYSSKNAERNNAVALKELLEGMKKPPSSSGPAKAAAASGRIAKRRPVS